MSDEYRVSILVEKNGSQLAGMPIVRRLIVNEDADILQIAAADNNTTSFHPIPAAVSPTMQLFLLTVDQAINLEINANTPLPLNANGLILIIGSALAQATPSDNIQFNNPGAVTAANLTGITAGS